MIRVLQKSLLAAGLSIGFLASGAVVECHPVMGSDDGVFPDFAEKPFLPIERLVRNELPSEGFEASFRCGWDHNFLYLEAVVTDDALIPAERALSWQNDIIEVYLDYTGNREKQNQFHWFPLLEKSGTPAFFSVADGRELSTAGVLTDTEITGDGYIARLAIPLDFFLEEGGVKLQNGSIIGFDLCVNNLADSSRNHIRHRFWSGDGTNWQSAAANGQMIFRRDEAGSMDLQDGFSFSLSDRYGLAIWPELPLLSGNSRLLATRQSPSAETYRPFSFGSIITELDEIQSERSEFSHTALGAFSPGEHLDNNRFLFTEIFAGDRHLTRLTSLFHPARIFRTDSEFVRLFAGAGSEGVPQRLLLPDGEIVNMEDLPEAIELKSGYMTVFFNGGAGDSNMPLLLFMSIAPQEVRHTANGALELFFGNRREKTIALMPLYGTRLIPVGEIPEGACERARFWYQTLLSYPMDMRESFRVVPEENLVEFRWAFEYAARRDDFPADEPVFLAPQSLLFANPLNVVQDLDMPLNWGAYRAAVGVRELVFRLPYPALQTTAEIPLPEDLELLSRVPEGRECIEKLNDGRFTDMVAAVVGAQRSSDCPVAHVAPYWEWSRLYQFLNAENKEKYRGAVRQALDGTVFAPELAHRLYPVRSFTGRSQGEYRNLTEPYGCPEPFWNIGQVLAGVFEYAYYTGDYEPVIQNWALIREMAEIIYIGGFAHYRYDGGRTLAAVLEGLIRSAEITGDTAYQDMVTAVYASYLATVSSFYRQSDWAVENHLYSQLGEAPEEFENAILFITRQPLYTGMNSGLYSGGYGCGYDSTYVLNRRVFSQAEKEIRKIEYELMPEFRPDWTALREWEWPESAVTRFGIRSLFLDEAPETVLRHYRELRQQPRIANDIMADSRLSCIYLEWLKANMKPEDYGDDK